MGQLLRFDEFMMLQQEGVHSFNLSGTDVQLLKIVENDTASFKLFVPLTLLTS